MPWNPNLVLMQLQVTKEHKARLKGLATEDRRSLASECLYLIELGEKARNAAVKREAQKAAKEG